MLHDEMERLIYQCLMGKTVVLIAPNDELASERFEEIRKAVVEADDELKRLMEETEKVIIYGEFMDSEPLGLISDYLESIRHLDKSTGHNRLQVEWNKPRSLRCNNYRNLHALPLKHRPRCRWRPRESRRSLEGLSPGIVVIDELHELVELVRR